MTERRWVSECRVVAMTTGNGVTARTRPVKAARVEMNSRKETVKMR